MANPPLRDRIGFTNGANPGRRSSSAALGRPDRPPGRTNGLINGRGRKDPLIGGHARNGLASGAGYTNGLPLNRNVFGVVSHSDLRRSAAILAGSLAVMLLLGYLLGAPPPTRSPFAVDGDFAEWSTVPLYSDPQDVGMADVDLIAYGVHETQGKLFVYGKVRGALFPGTGPSSVFVLIDNEATPGYAAPGLSADWVGELWGLDGSLQGASLREWRGASDPDNATSLQQRGAFPAAVVGDEFEFALDDIAIDLDPGRGGRMLIATRSDNVIDTGAVIGLTPGALVVTPRSLTNVLLSAAPVLELRMAALAADIQVTGISLDHSGGGTVSLPAFPVVIAAGQEVVEYVGLDPGGLQPGAFVTLRVAGVTATAIGTGASVAPTISGDGARVYVQVPPTGKAVDGLFGDWTNVTPDPVDPVPSSVDLRGSAFAVERNAFFYVTTEGNILTGAILPERHERLLNQSGRTGPEGPVYLPRRAGEDVLRVYVDTDDGDPNGEPFAGILADRWLEVRGRLGRVTSKALYAWNPATSAWDGRTDPFDVAFLGGQLEAATPLSFLGPLNNPRVVFAMSDWSARGDITDLLGPQRTSGASGPVQPLHGPGAQSIVATPLVNVPKIDGRCDSSLPLTEYDGANTGSNANITFRVGRRDDIQFIFLCITVLADSTDNPGDFGEIMFDTAHNGGMLPQTDDRLFWVFAHSTVLGDAAGDGFLWVSPCGVCDPGDAAAADFRGGGGGHPVFEFKIRYADVWGTNTPVGTRVAGFAVLAWNDSIFATYTWGSTAVDDSVPATWGHIIIPEFPTPALAALAAIVIPVVRRRPFRRGE